MLNYIKFVLYLILVLCLAIPKLIKYELNPSKYSVDEMFSFLQKHARKALSIVNINLNVLGKDRLPEDPSLFIINHSSMLDSFILLASVDRPIGVVIADVPVWRNMPVISHWVKLIKCVYINRENTREGIKSIIETSKNIIEGHSMAIFPEGDLTWVKDPNALISDFRAGSLKIAYKANCPIIPLVIKNSKETYSGYEPIGKIKSMNVEVEFLDPVYDHIENPKLKSTVLSNEIKDNMIDVIAKFQKKRS
ncbi:MULTISPECIES: lysophospholipid acyltransferase family protein [unclassified Romboutsia]|uniref:lysophospholipid acyltransferase family protein n=1 Tax=unclassified Romboutsia TaxID=2626894 RepID=UPI000820D1ED|nr:MULTISPECIES: lysophospholipid acyltransferase family protein [unclassified Romboutsia]SCH72033.1 2-acyl-glycerophospho-ethanolamine acyltransferase [uncultured Clostridium sp.]